MDNPSLIDRSGHFEFGRNWQMFLLKMTDANIQAARRSLEAFHGRQTLQGCRFLDVGCGSGIHSYVAYLMGASEIVSFDLDPISVECCRELKALKAPEASHWKIMEGNILSEHDRRHWVDFDLVYAWGSLHHTGAMWKAIAATGDLVKPGGEVHLAIYNKHWTSPIWKRIKRAYGISPKPVKELLLLSYAAADCLRVLLREHQNPMTHIRNYSHQRGMRWHEDMRDWLGGYPYEYASREDILDFMKPRGFELHNEILNSNTGCSEFLFRKISQPDASSPELSLLPD